MSSEKIRTGQEKHLRLLDNLQNLLKEQLELAHQASLGQVELLGKQVEPLVQEIAQAKVLELPEFRQRRMYLQRLYEEICLALTAQQADTSRELSQVRKGKKAIGAYRNNI